jgi:hypothetical protein
MCNPLKYNLAPANRTKGNEARFLRSLGMTGLNPDTFGWIAVCS